MELKDVGHALLMIGIVVYLLSAIYPWHVMLYNSIDTNTSVSEGIAPAGLWFSETQDNNTIKAVIVEYPNDNNTNATNQSAGANLNFQNRNALFDMIRLLYVATFILIIAVIFIGIFGIKKAYYIGSLIVALVIIIGVVLFLLQYQNALDSDLQGTNLSGISMYGGEVNTMSHMVYSSLGLGFMLSLAAPIMFLIASSLYLKDLNKSPTKKKSPNKSSSKSGGVTAGATAVVHTQPAHHVNIQHMVLQCPNCGNTFEVDVNMDHLPVSVQCPYCGTKGEIGGA